MIRWSVAALVILWLLLPVRLPSTSSRPSTGECLTLSDTVPDAARPDLVRFFEGCVATNTTDVDLWADLGRLYESRERWADAEAAYRRAIGIDGGLAEIRIRLARLLLKRGDATGARQEAEAAERVQPNRQAILDLLEEADSKKHPTPFYENGKKGSGVFSATGQ